jgi:hypothetical protein
MTVLVREILGGLFFIAEDLCETHHSGRLLELGQRVPEVPGQPGL